MSLLSLLIMLAYNELTVCFCVYECIPVHCNKQNTTKYMQIQGHSLVKDTTTVKDTIDLQQITCWIWMLQQRQIRDFMLVKEAD